MPLRGMFPDRATSPWSVAHYFPGFSLFTITLNLHALVTESHEDQVHGKCPASVKVPVIATIHFLPPFFPSFTSALPSHAERKVETIFCVCEMLNFEVTVGGVTPHPSLKSSFRSEPELMKNLNLFLVQSRQLGNKGPGLAQNGKLGYLFTWEKE